MGYQERNKHVRDEYITFDPIKHIYNVQGVEYVSVTTLIHKYFPEFKADEVIDKMMKSKTWNTSKYYGMKKEEIKELWNNKGKKSSELGTILHDRIENFYLNGCLDDKNDDKCYNQFLNFYNDEKLIPYRTEWRIFSDDHKVAGSVDIIFEGNKEGSVKLYDWKRSQEIKLINEYEKGLYPINNISNCNYEHYTLQLNIYKYLLENYYGIMVEEMAIIVFCENNNNYQKFVLKNKQEEVNKLLNHYINNNK
jgi:ATP-dependent exoDNAse (exonuclease V) beta subunit